MPRSNKKEGGTRHKRKRGQGENKAVSLGMYLGEKTNWRKRIKIKKEKSSAPTEGKSN